MQVREFIDGCDVSQPLVVRQVEVRRRRDGAEYLKLALGDRTGSVTAMVWDEVPQVRELCRLGEIVHVSGRYSVHARYGPQLGLQALRPAAEADYDVDELVDGPPRRAEQMETDLRELLATIQNPHLRRLLAIVFGEGSPTWAAYRDAPAAKYYHQAYRHGLLEHSLTVAQAVSAISATFPGVDRDVAVTGALLHDIGKLEAYRMEGGTIDGFPPELAQAVLHIILSHHGSLEHGSPVVPCTREATLVHMVDNLGGRLGSFDRIEKELPAGAQWSPFDKGIGGGAYFAARAEAERQAA